MGYHDHNQAGGSDIPDDLLLATDLRQLLARQQLFRFNLVHEYDLDVRQEPIPGAVSRFQVAAIGP